MINSNKWRVEFEDAPIIYNPLGLEKKHANRFSFCALLQLILIFWIGAESLYHPQLIENYTFYFIILFVFFYTFSFYWIFIDLWKYAKIEVILHGVDIEELERKNKKAVIEIEKMISFLKIKNFSRLSIISFLIFLILNSLNALFSLLSTYNIFPLFQFSYTLPGTGIEDSNPIYLSYILYLILLIPPIITIWFFKIVSRDINKINKERLEEVLKFLPEHVKINILENLKALNKRIREELKFE